MCKTLLCYSQDFVNEIYEKDKHASVDVYMHPHGGHPIVVTHTVPEDKLDELRKNFPKIFIFAELEDGVAARKSYQTDAGIYYRPVADWQKKVGITADDLMVADRKKQDEITRSVTSEIMKQGERSSLSFRPRFAV